ncbi:hypothetical protein F2Q69_00042389 [Brassica cretica]|uniref:Uncharacterized protein n=1 Tax=Brassica cretica TaxID=69181 RepID=A0A8S9NNW8_BRACR|nr:hypothetical protein F2Q69_00042389 [Brassica cretica]
MLLFYSTEIEISKLSFALALPVFDNILCSEPYVKLTCLHKWEMMIPTYLFFRIVMLLNGGVIVFVVMPICNTPWGWNILVGGKAVCSPVAVVIVAFSVANGFFCVLASLRCVLKTPLIASTFKCLVINTKLEGVCCFIAYYLFFGEDQLYTYMVLIFEVTTSEINLRGYFDISGLKQSEAYLINEVAIFLTWYVKRLMITLEKDSEDTIFLEAGFKVAESGRCRFGAIWKKTFIGRASSSYLHR